MEGHLIHGTALAKPSRTTTTVGKFLLYCTICPRPLDWTTGLAYWTRQLD